MKLLAIAAAGTLALLTTTALATPSLAQDSGVLTGKAAFGDYQQDKPGVKRLITSKDLEAPGATASASSSTPPAPCRSRTSSASGSAA